MAFKNTSKSGFFAGLAVAVAVTALFGAPARAQSLPYTVNSIAAVTVGAPPAITDFTADGAILRFRSAIPLACSVIYGETTAYGQIAVDRDMDGGAHADHQPPMAGLKPNTLYHFRVQGVAADGTFYASRDATFRTPPAKKRSTPVNLLSPAAGARIVRVSSNYGGGGNGDAWGAASAVDGKGRTAWSSNGDGNAAFVEIELEQRARLDAVAVWTRTMSDGTAQITKFKLTTDSGKVLGPFTLKDATRAYRFKIDATAKRLRLDVIASSGGNTGLVEFAAFGTPMK